MNLLLVGHQGPWSLETIYQRAFSRSGVDNVELFPSTVYDANESKGLIGRITRRLREPFGALSATRRLIGLLQDNGRKYDAVVVFKGYEFTRATLEAARRLAPNAVWANINPDDPFNLATRGSSNRLVVDSIPFFDIYFTWSERLIQQLRNQGVRRALYLPFGYDPELHSASREESAGNDAVSFFGCWDSEREAFLSKLTDFDLRIYGTRWARATDPRVRRCVISPSAMYGAELASVVATSAVNLNLLRQQNYGEHNMRTFEIPAMKGLMLTARSVVQDRYFPDGIGCMMYGDSNELRSQIKFALAKPDLRRDIRTQAFNLAQTHSYTQRAATVVAALTSA